MDPDITPPQNTNGNNGFQKKPLEQPIFGTEMRDRLSGAARPSGGQMVLEQPRGFKNFYRQNKIYFWAIVAGIIIIAALAIWAFHKTPAAAPQQAKVNISVQAPDTVSGGGEEVYTATITNNDTQTLANVQLELVYPDGETYESSVPNATNISGTLFPVPNLNPGQNVVVTVKTKVLGNINDVKTLTLKLHYTYNNSSAEFIAQQAFDVRLVASNTILQLTGPDSTSNSQIVQYTLNYQNNSGSDIQNARIQMDYPDGFVFAAGTPQPDLSNNIWDIGTLAAGGQGTITIQGTFSAANPGESKTATAEFLVLGSNGQYFTQNTATFTTSLSSLPLLVTQQLNPNNSTGVVNPGDTLQFSIQYQNNSSVAATGVSVTATLNSPAVDLSTLQSQGAQVNNNTITWDASSVANLASLSPNDSGTLNFSVQVKNPATQDSSKNLTVVSDVKIKSNEYQTAFPGNELTLKISSPFTMQTGLDFVGGSLPPKVGTNTVYKVTISLTNSTNDFSNVVVSGFIPLGAGGFVNNSVNLGEANNFSYDPSTSKFTWKVGALPAHTGQFTDARTLQFNVQLNPASSQAGNSVILVKTLTLDGTDIFTSQPVHNSSADITTANISGNSYSNGVVSQ